MEITILRDKVSQANEENKQLKATLASLNKDKATLERKCAQQATRFAF